jgi:hypothetical protein
VENEVVAPEPPSQADAPAEEVDDPPVAEAPEPAQEAVETAPEPETASEPNTAVEPEIAAGAETASEPEAGAEPETASKPENAAESEGAPEPETASDPETGEKPETDREPKTAEEVTGFSPEGDPALTSPDEEPRPGAEPQTPTDTKPEEIAVDPVVKAVDIPSVVPPADPGEVEKAKNAEAVVIDPAAPPAPPTNVTQVVNNTNYVSQVNTVINRNTNIAVNIDNTTVIRPRTWSFLDYDASYRPFFYNPCGQNVWVRYWYADAYRVAYVPVGGRVVLPVSDRVVYPYTVLGTDFVASGYFNGGGYAPPVYRNVAAYVPTYQQTVRVSRVTYVGHDASRPVGERDSFMLDDTTLAWGTKTDDSNITIARTQTTPGVGPTDDGASLVKLAAAEQSSNHTLQWVLGAALAVVILTAGVTLWMVRRPRGRA